MSNLSPVGFDLLLHFGDFGAEHTNFILLRAFDEEVKRSNHGDDNETKEPQLLTQWDSFDRRHIGKLQYHCQPLTDTLSLNWYTGIPSSIVCRLSSNKTDIK